MRSAMPTFMGCSVPYLIMLPPVSMFIGGIAIFVSFCIALAAREPSRSRSISTHSSPRAAARSRSDSPSLFSETKLTAPLSWA